VFLRAGQIAILDMRRAEVLDNAARHIQGRFRTFITRKEFVKTREASVSVQAYCRGKHLGLSFGFIVLFWERHTTVKWWQKTVKRVIALSTKWTGMNYISFMFQFNCILQTAPFFAPRSSNCLTGSNSCCWSQRTIHSYSVSKWTGLKYNIFKFDGC